MCTLWDRSAQQEEVAGQLARQYGALLQSWRQGDSTVGGKVQYNHTQSRDRQHWLVNFATRSTFFFCITITQYPVQDAGTVFFYYHYTLHRPAGRHSCFCTAITHYTTKSYALFYCTAITHYTTALYFFLTHFIIIDQVSNSLHVPHYFPIPSYIIFFTTKKQALFFLDCHYTLHIFLTSFHYYRLGQ